MHHNISFAFLERDVIGIISHIDLKHFGSWFEILVGVSLVNARMNAPNYCTDRKQLQ